MASFNSLNFNNGQSINLGYITSYWGLYGYNPIETIRPTGLNLNKLKKQVQDLYTSDVESAVNVIANVQYSSYNEANTALDAVADTLINHVYWLYGDLYTGGCFIWSASGSGSCQFVNFYGLYHVEDLIQGNYYEYFSGSNNFDFRVHANGDLNQPIIDNVIYFFNANETPQGGETNHVMDSEHELKIVTSESLGVWSGYDIKTSDLPETWEQGEEYANVYTNTEFEAFYLRGYTTDDYNSNVPHPWKRISQVRVVPNRQFFTGIVVSNGELVGGYVPIEKTDAVTGKDDDPSGGGSGGPVGGNGPQDDASSDVGIGTLPSSDFLETGIARIYLPTKAQMTAFNQFIFSDISQSLVDQLKKMWSNPLDYIENLGVCRLSGLGFTGVDEISFGGISTGVNCNYTNNAFREFSYTCSALYEKWNSALDYSNYTRLKIYVPYCGIYDIAIDEFQTAKGLGSVKLTYRVDLMSGMCVAFLIPYRPQYDKHYKNLEDNAFYQFNGNIYLPLSITATDWRNTYNSVLNIAGGMIAPSPSAVAGMATDIMGQKVNVQHSGSIGTNFGYMGVQKPYFIVERPAKSEPYLNEAYSYKTNYGYPVNEMYKLGNVKGFVKVRKGSFWANNLHATDEEREEIINLFENEGVWMN